MWHVLGVEPTSDKKAIKRAYAAKLKDHHPEDDPEGFQALHEAYQSALNATKYMTPAPERAVEPEPELETVGGSPEMASTGAARYDAPNGEALSQAEAEVSAFFAQTPEDGEGEEDVPNDDGPKARDLIVQLQSFAPGTPLLEWRMLFEQAVELPISERTEFENALFNFMTAPTPQKDSQIMAERMNERVFEIIDEFFAWRDNELELIDRYDFDPAHAGVFIECLNSRGAMSPNRVVEFFDDMLSAPHKSVSPKYWQDFFAVARALSKRERRRISRDVFAALVRNYSVSRPALNVGHLSALDRLFGWTHTVLGSWPVFFSGRYRRLLTPEIKELRELLIYARDEPFYYLPDLAYGTSRVGLVFGAAYRVLKWPMKIAFYLLLFRIFGTSAFVLILLFYLVMLAIRGVQRLTA